MLQINAVVLSKDGSSVPAGVVVSPNLNTADIRPQSDGKTAKTKVSLSFFVNKAASDGNYDPFIPITDAVIRKKMYDCIITMTIAEAQAPTKAVMAAKPAISPNVQYEYPSPSSKPRKVSPWNKVCSSAFNWALFGLAKA